MNGITFDWVKCLQLKKQQYMSDIWEKDDHVEEKACGIVLHPNQNVRTRRPKDKKLEKSHIGQEQERSREDGFLRELLKDHLFFLSR
jgi:hypothetical protein